MSKRDDESAEDVGMTTAERRRRRRRGGGLRVPSDNVPRRTNPPVVAPVPEDPSLAMSIAYSFSSTDSEPVPRVTVETPVPRPFPDTVAPEAMPTVIDPPAPVEGADFDMKTREMTAVDLAALGLEDTTIGNGSSNPALPAAGRDELPNVRFKRPARAASDDVDVTLDEDDEATAIAEPPVKRERRERVKTVALSDDDLEEVRESMRKETAPVAPAPVVHRAPTAPIAPPANPHSAVTKPMDAVQPPPAPLQGPTPKKPTTEPQNPTQLSASDIEVVRAEEPLSVPEIDINELSDRADSTDSGEFEVEVDEDDKPAATAPSTAATPSTAAAQATRPRPSSVPPPVTQSQNIPIAPAAATTHPGVPPPPPAQAKDREGHPHPPPPPPAAHHKAPPAPPPKPAAAASRDSKPAPPPAAKAEPKPDPKKAKPWFVDLFDEDYLRTLPFLTPQATQAEAEFVINAMGLSPGAQVLDVGCGYGRHAMELAARGFHVVGLDLSTPLLVRGGEEAHRRGLQINFVRGDMRELDFEAQFDGAYCLFSTFGYFDDETNKKTVANIARALRPGGRLMIEILNRDYVIADLPTRVWWEGEGCVVLEEVELNYFSSRIQVNRSVVFDDGRQLEQEISVRAYSLHEVGKLMHAAGFRVLEVSGGYHTRGRFFGNQSRHIIVLAERKDSTGA